MESTMPLSRVLTILTIVSFGHLVLAQVELLTSSIDLPTSRQSSACGISYAFPVGTPAAMLQSTNYPANYPATQCTYTINSPFGTYMRVNCTDFNVPCTGDVMYFSLNGNTNLAGSQGYCGSGNIQLASSGNGLVVRLSPVSTSTGLKRFQCLINVTSL